jgi:hypothetical protein
MLLTLSLVKVLGARRARTFAQILTWIFSALLVFSAQLPSLLNDRTVASQAVREKWRVLFEPGSPLGADSWIWFPVRAIFFEPLSVVLTLLISATLIPVWLLLPPLFIISIVRGEAWLMPLLVFSIATTSTAILRLWNSRPISATSPLERRQQHAIKDMLLFFLEMVAFFLWGFVGFQAGLGQIVPMLFGMAIAAVLMAIAYYRSRKLGTSLGF